MIGNAALACSNEYIIIGHLWQNKQCTLWLRMGGKEEEVVASPFSLKASLDDLSGSS